MTEISILYIIFFSDVPDLPVCPDIIYMPMCLTDSEKMEQESETLSRQSFEEDSDTRSYTEEMEEEFENRKSLQTVFMPLTGVLGFFTAYKCVI